MGLRWDYFCPGPLDLLLLGLVLLRRVLILIQSCIETVVLPNQCKWALLNITNAHRYVPSRVCKDPWHSSVGNSTIRNIAVATFNIQVALHVGWSDVIDAAQFEAGVDLASRALFFTLPCQVLELLDRRACFRIVCVCVRGMFRIYFKHA